MMPPERHSPTSEDDKPNLLLRLLHLATLGYAFILTLLLWLPDPRVLLWGRQPGEEVMGYSHLITFTLLGFLVELGRRRRSFFFWATLLLGYVFLTEIVQEILPVRSFDVNDIVQDLAGLYFGFWIATLCRRIHAALPFSKREKGI